VIIIQQSNAHALYPRGNLEMSRLKLFVAAIAACLVLSSSVRAQDIVDPSTLHVSSPGATGTDPVLLGSNVKQVTVSQTASGQDATDSTPVYLIIGIRNDSSTNFFGTTNPISSVQFSQNATTNSASFGTPATGFGVAGVTPSTLTASSTTGYFTQLNSGQDVYQDLLGIQGGGNASESFTNWSSQEPASAGTTTTYGLYVFNLNGTLDKSGSVTVKFSSALPDGAYVIALADHKPFTTPFTHAGLTGSSTVPVPPSAILLALGGLGLFGFLRRNRQPITA
jgi:hypothetical protein